MTRNIFFKSLLALAVAPVSVLTSKKTIGNQVAYFPQSAYRWSEQYYSSTQTLVDGNMISYAGLPQRLPEEVLFEKEVGDIIRMQRWQKTIKIHKELTPEQREYFLSRIQQDQP